MKAWKITVLDIEGATYERVYVTRSVKQAIGDFVILLTDANVGISQIAYEKIPTSEWIGK